MGIPRQLILVQPGFGPTSGMTFNLRARMKAAIAFCVLMKTRIPVDAQALGIRWLGRTNSMEVEASTPRLGTRKRRSLSQHSNSTCWADWRGLPVDRRIHGLSDQLCSFVPKKDAVNIKFLRLVR